MEKLIRDKIPEIIAQKGEKAEVYVADDKVYAEKLLQKLREEADEVVEAKSSEERVAELVDVREVLEAIMNFFIFLKMKFLFSKRKRSLSEVGLIRDIF